MKNKNVLTIIDGAAIGTIIGSTSKRISDIILRAGIGVGVGDREVLFRKGK